MQALTIGIAIKKERTNVHGISYSPTLEFLPQAKKHCAESARIASTYDAAEERERSRTGFEVKSRAILDYL